MEPLSPKQYLFAKYLLAQLGFTENEFTTKYREILRLVAPRYRMFGAIRQDSPEAKKLDDLAIQQTFDHQGNYLVPQKFDIIDYLLHEVKVKKGLQVKRRENGNRRISATDISNYTYCRVSHAISKTFETEKLESAQIGTSLHETKRLINYLGIKKTPYEKLIAESDEPIASTLPHDSFRTEQNEFFFEILKHSDLVFSGHDEAGREQYFISKKGNYVGQPDYIFRNKVKNEFFVVEEKFQFLPRDPDTYYENNFSDSQTQHINRRRNRSTFFENHINQIRSYIFGIEDYKINLGYLIYWKYEFQNYNPVIVSCNVLTVEKNQQNRSQLVSKFLELRNSLQAGGGDFDASKLDPARCASCVANLLCGHKTGKFDKYTVPYSNQYLKTYRADFPPELRKDYTPPQSNSDDLPF